MKDPTSGNKPPENRSDCWCCKGAGFPASGLPPAPPGEFNTTDSCVLVSTGGGRGEKRKVGMRFMVRAIALRSLLFFLGMEADPTPAVGEPLGLAASPPSVGVLFRQLSAAAGGAAVDRRCMALRSLAMGDAPGASSALFAGAKIDARDAGRPTFAGPVAAFTEAAPLSMTHTCRWHYCQKCCVATVTWSERATANSDAQLD